MDELHRRLDPQSATPPPPRTKPQRAIPAPKSKPISARLAVPARLPDSAPPADQVPETDPAHPSNSAPSFDPESLIGLKPAQAIAVLGDPASVQERSPSMVWRYDQGDCALDLFFYMDLGANAFRVLAYEIRNGSSPDGSAVACPARLVSRANGR